jgi:ABC-2 type transport system ATP-binding protein
MVAVEVSAVKIQGLDFSYSNEATCFTGLRLEIAKGERFGLFGPNGAGKTTLMNCMTGLLSSEGGSVQILGYDIKKEIKTIKKLIGFVPQDLAFYQELSPLENFEFFGALSGLDKSVIKKRSTELLEILDLTSVKNKQVGKFSGGMKRRVNLGIGVLHEPTLLFLDEPTVGVDVQTRQTILNYLRELNARGTTLIYTSHQLSEAQELCNKIALINEGKIIAHDTPEQLFSTYNQKDLESLFISLTSKTRHE